MATLHLLCGLPGAGKSTLARKIEQEHRALRLTSDEWMSRLIGNGRDNEKRKIIEHIQWEIAQQVLSFGIDAILEAGFWSREERDQFRARATELGAHTKLYYLDVPREELIRRLEIRNANLPEHTFQVTAEDIDEWTPLFQVPAPEELLDT